MHATRLRIEVSNSNGDMKMQCQLGEFSNDEVLCGDVLGAPQLRAGEVCDAHDPAACGGASTLSRRLLWISGVIWSCGFFVVSAGADSREDGSVRGDQAGLVTADEGDLWDDLVDVDAGLDA